MIVTLAPEAITFRCYLCGEFCTLRGNSEVGEMAHPHPLCEGLALWKPHAYLLTMMRDNSANDNDMTGRPQ